MIPESIRNEAVFRRGLLCVGEVGLLDSGVFLWSSRFLEYLICNLLRLLSTKNSTAIVGVFHYPLFHQSYLFEGLPLKF